MRYLSGEALDQQPEQVDPAIGDYITRIHQAVKLHIRLSDYRYQWPRFHSFNGLIDKLLALGLIEHTGQRADPELRGAGIVGVEHGPDGAVLPGGFKQRVWVRLTPGSAERPEWEDPNGALINLRAGLPVRPKRVPGPPTVPTPVSAPAPAAPARPKITRRITPEAPVTVTGPEPELVALDARRRQLIIHAQQLSNKGGQASEFSNLTKRAQAFIKDVSRLLGDPALYGTYSDAVEATEQLGICVIAMQKERALAKQKEAAETNCKRWAGLLDEGLRPNLPPKPAAPIKPAKEPRRIARKTVRRREQSETKMLESKLTAIKEQVEGWAKPNPNRADKLVDQFISESGYEETELGLNEVREMIEEYRVLSRSDFDSAEEYREAREEAWQNVLDSFDEVDFSDLEAE